jgi:hypothetical protein
MRPPKTMRCACLAIVSVALASCAAAPTIKDTDNGIFVDAKIYNTRTLETQLQTLSNRLGQISGIDQASLISRLGGIQGASSSQFAMNLQATGLASPAVTSTTTNGTPSIAQTVGGTTTTGTPSVAQTTGSTTNTSTPQTVDTVNGATPTSPATSQTVTTTVSNTTGTTSQTLTTTPSNTVATTNQTVTTTPSNTVQNVSAMPATTPAPPPLPTMTPLATPSSYGMSALDTLNEQMQLSYQIINLQLLLQGALSDEYTPVYGLGKRHVTFGFPISVATPLQYRGDAAEVEVSVCNPANLKEAVAPTVQTIIPQEKTYNVASIVGSSKGLGAGAVVGSVVNIGANFAWTHQTYYLVKQQDTVALRRAHGLKVPACNDSLPPATFAWQFRPVLGQKTIDQGPRSLFAQLAFAPSAAFPLEESGMVAQVAVRTCWREYDRKSGIVGGRIEGSCDPAPDQPARMIPVTTGYDTLAIHGIDSIDNGDGTLTTTVYGRFPAGTRVGLGEAYLNESMPGFENSGGSLRFTATAQMMAVRGPRLLSPDGTIKLVQLTGELDEPANYLTKSSRYFAPGHFAGTPQLTDGATRIDVDSSDSRGISFAAPPKTDLTWKTRYTFMRPFKAGFPATPCHVPFANSPETPAQFAPYSDALVKVSLPIWQCLEMGSLSVPPMYVVIMNGRAFGLSDAPFLSLTGTEISFLVPKAFIQGVTSLKLKRLFLDNEYESSYTLIPPTVSVSAITAVRSTKLDATFAITGSGLNHATFEINGHQRVICCSGTYALITLTSQELASTKVFYLRPNDQGTPIPVTLPAVAKLTDDGSDVGKVQFPIAISRTDKGHTTYAITSIPESPSLEAATFIDPPPAKVQIVKQDAKHLLFTLAADDATAYKVVFIQLMNPGKPATTGSPAVAPTPRAIVPLTLPMPAKPEDTAATATKKVTFDEKQATLKKGATGSYTIHGTNFDLVLGVRYLGIPLTPPILVGTDNKTLTVNLPANFTAATGGVPLEIQVAGASIPFDVTVE